MSWSNFDSSMQNEGGFMDTTVGDGAGGEDKGNMKRGQNCVPVMISHLIRYGEKISVWGTPARIVTILGVVRKIDSASTKVSFEIQDETGTIKGIKWLEGDNASFESPVKVNTYAKVSGLVRDQNEEPYILIVNIQPMEHMNELLAHLMEVTVMSLQGEKMSNNKGGFGNQSFANSSVQNGHMSMNNGSNASGLTQPQQVVLDIIKNSDPEYGAERDTIKARVPSHLVSKVDEIIEFLSAEGHIYTTKTDDFFKAI